MKHRSAPRQISLKELGPEGREFDFTQATGEFNAILKDLIGSNPYHIQIQLTPMGNSYDLKGTLTTAMDLMCSVCAEEYKQPVNLTLKEWIVIEPAIGKGEQTSKANHAHEWESDGPNYIVLQNDQFDVGDYAHEAIGLAEPIRPLCAPGTPEGCIRAGDKIDRPWLSYGQEEKAESQIRANPFQVLEKMKLKS